MSPWSGDDRCPGGCARAPGWSSLEPGIRVDLWAAPRESDGRCRVLHGAGRVLRLDGDARGRRGHITRTHLHSSMPYRYRCGYARSWLCAVTCIKRHRVCHHMRRAREGTNHTTLPHSLIRICLASNMIAYILSCAIACYESRAMTHRHTHARLLAPCAADAGVCPAFAGPLLAVQRIVLQQEPI